MSSDADLRKYGTDQSLAEFDARYHATANSGVLKLVNHPGDSIRDSEVDNDMRYLMESIRKMAPHSAMTETD